MGYGTNKSFIRRHRDCRAIDQILYKKGLGVLFISILLILSSILATKYLYKRKVAGEVKVDLALAVQAAEKQEYQVLKEYACAIIDTKGKVQFSTLPDFVVDQQINLHRLAILQKKEDMSTYVYSSPIICDTVQSGTLLIELQCDKLTYDPLGLLFVGIAIGLFGIFLVQMLKIYKILRGDIFQPIYELDFITNKIAHGDYDTKITYQANTSIGVLCQQLELMREELKLGRERECSLREKEKLITASLSHDLKTPVATIFGAAEAINKGVVKEKEMLEHISTIIMNKANFLTKMINDILDSVSVELDEQSFAMEETYIKEYMETILVELREDVETAGRTLEVGTIPEMLLMISRERMQQVMQNLVGNAIKYTNENGVIHIRFRTTNDYFIVQVEDDGQGIAACDIPFIFDKFYRGEEARTQKETSGSGLGLYIVKSVINRHGGMVECDSVLGKGTTIQFTLPKIIT
ncbi:sensor histidine kinase [Anaerosporobacter faecicola]|uniref:sensor histidine kinase n=1 Tax=Anaerosporobacter faecicola TaxID=2718714 RepID=UPI001439A78E|nr:HAMP domain-containing sensor histidine kinase [Anaerosporobacter faecicola]